MQETEETQIYPWVGKVPWRKAWQPTPVFLPGEFPGWRSLTGYSPRGCKESDTTERLQFQFSSPSPVGQDSGLWGPWTLKSAHLPHSPTYSLWWTQNYNDRHTSQALEFKTSSSLTAWHFLDCLSISLTSVSMRPLTGPNSSTLVDLRTSEKSTKAK